ncbi:MAG: hypothetical protein IJV20_08235 [Prevotella sp.]|nr:hypothetical protein [Prevotella sp.]
MAGCAIAGVARHALRRGGVARLPAVDEVWLTDKGTRETDVLYLCIVEELPVGQGTAL